MYNTFPLNDCPDELWSKLDAKAIAAENDAAAAFLNGPRYWLMSSIEKAATSAPDTKTFGGIEMIKQATVVLSSMNPRPIASTGEPQGRIQFRRGRRVLRAHRPRRAALGDADLESDRRPPTCPWRTFCLAARLTLPNGWSYQTRTFTSPLRVDTSTRKAHVTQDDFANSYSLQTS